MTSVVVLDGRAEGVLQDLCENILDVHWDVSVQGEYCQIGYCRDISN